MLLTATAILKRDKFYISRQKIRPGAYFRFPAYGFVFCCLFFFPFFHSVKGKSGILRNFSSVNLPSARIFWQYLSPFFYVLFYTHL